MKKVFTLIVLLCVVCTGAWADIQSSTVENPVPYLIRNFNCGYIANDLSRYHANSTDENDEYGQFIFIEAETENQYKIYELSTKKYFSAKASFNTSAKAQTELVADENAATVWVINLKSNNPDKYTISPSSNTGTFLNFHGGKDDSGNIAGAVGFHTNGDNDEGSFWLFENYKNLPESPIQGKVYTIINDHKGVPYYLSNTYTSSCTAITETKSNDNTQKWIMDGDNSNCSFYNVANLNPLKVHEGQTALVIKDERKSVGYTIARNSNPTQHMAGNRSTKTLSGGLFTNGKYNGYDNSNNDYVWSTDFVFVPTGEYAYKVVINGGGSNSSVTYGEKAIANNGFIVMEEENHKFEASNFTAPELTTISSFSQEGNIITITLAIGIADGIYEINNQSGSVSRGYFVHSDSYPNAPVLAETKLNNYTDRDVTDNRHDGNVNPYFGVKTINDKVYIYSLANGKFLTDGWSDVAVGYTMVPSKRNPNYVTLQNTNQSGDQFLCNACGNNNGKENHAIYTGNKDGGNDFVFEAVDAEEVVLLQKTYAEQIARAEFAIDGKWNLVIEGLPDGIVGGVRYNNQDYTGAQVALPYELNQNDVTAIEVENYIGKITSISNDTKTITVTYTPSIPTSDAIITATTLLAQQIAIGMPSQHQRELLQAALDKANEDDSEVNISALEAAITAYNSTNDLHLPTGYYKIKNAENGHYAFNYLYEDGITHHTHLKASGAEGLPVDNTIYWRVINHGDGTITICNGDGIGVNTEEQLNKKVFHFSPYNAGEYALGSVLFTEGMTYSTNGNEHIEFSEGQTTQACRWMFENAVGVYINSVNVYSFTDVPLKGRVIWENSMFGAQEAYDYGFFISNAANVITTTTVKTTKAITLTATPFTGKKHAFYISESKDDGVSSIYMTYYDQSDFAKLTARVSEIYTRLNPGDLGYPNINDTEQAPIIWGAYTQFSAASNGLLTINDTNIDEASYYINTLLRLRNVNKPTPSNFYTLTDNSGKTTTYYLNENSQLIEFSNGQFTKHSAGKVGNYPIGTTSGESVTFDRGYTSTLDEEGYTTTLFGKLSITTNNGGNVYPSGDNQLGSGWTMTEVSEVPVTLRKVTTNTVNNSQEKFYGTFYAPIDMTVDAEHVKAYVAVLNDEESHITFTPIDGGNIPAGTAVMLEGDAEGEFHVGIHTGAAFGELSMPNSLKGTAYTQSYTFNDYDKYGTLNGEPAGFHAYTLQSGGRWKLYDNTKLAGFKAYLELHDVDEAGRVREFTFSFDDEEHGQTTGLGEILGINEKMPENVYDLSGRVSSVDQKGIFIKNGQKYIK